MPRTPKPNPEGRPTVYPGKRARGVVSLTPKALRHLRAAANRMGVSQIDIMEALIRHHAHDLTEAVMRPGVIRAPRKMYLTAEASHALTRTQRRLAASISPIMENLIDQYLPTLPTPAPAGSDPRVN